MLFTLRLCLILSLAAIVWIPLYVRHGVVGWYNRLHPL